MVPVADTTPAARPLITAAEAEVVATMVEVAVAGRMAAEVEATLAVVANHIVKTPPARGGVLFLANLL